MERENTRKRPNDGLQPLDTSELATPESWAQDLPDAAAWTDELEELDDIPDFDPADREVSATAALDGDRAMLRRPARRIHVDFRSSPIAYRHLRRVPREGESLHGVICGRYAMWDLVPALLERTGARCTELTIATLSYSRQNAEQLLQLVDAGQIGSVTLLVSYYFRAQNQELYDSLVPELLARAGKGKRPRHQVLAMRTHAKILLLRLSNGARFVCEGSANLRSCKNVEQFVLSRDRRLFNFHRRWIHGELIAANRRE